MSEKKIQISIDKLEVEAVAGEDLIDVIHRAGIKVPSLCYHPDLKRMGSCRACLVEIDGIKGEVPACEFEVEEGMVVRASSARLEEAHKSVLQMLLMSYVDHDHDSAQLDNTEFGYWLKQYQLNPADYGENDHHYPVDSDPHPAIRVDLNKCILCSRCVRACEDIQGRHVWGIAARSDRSHLVAGMDSSMLDARCESCGACVAYCPTGALANRDALPFSAADKVVTTTCPYCGVGCNFDLNIKAGRLSHVSSNPAAAVNGMHLCVKGRYGQDFVQHPDRLTHPQVRQWLLDGKERKPGEDRGEWVKIGWDQALDLVAQRFNKVVNESSADAIGVFASAKCSNEENYLMQKFARQVIGTHNIDHCARLCHSSTVAGLAAAFGSGAMSNTMADLADTANAIFVIGSNTTEQHPVFGSHLRQAVQQRKLKLVVADPRAIDLCEFACLHLQQKPGTDIALLNGIMHQILEQGWHDEAFINDRTEGFAEFRAGIANYPPAIASEISDVPVEQIIEAANILGQAKPMAVIWAMGITQHTSGVQNVLSLANLQMLTGNMGIPVGGVNPLRGQNNVQGACDMGTLPNVFPGYQKVADAGSIEKFAQAWSLQQREQLFSDNTGLTVTEMIDGCLTGNVKGLYILGENPLMTDPDLNHVREAMQASEFTVLQEIFPSETADYADVLLPGASFAEKSGTFTNTERRIQLIRPALTPPGEARADWDIISDLALRVMSEAKQSTTGEYAGWEYTSAAEIMDEIAALTPSYAGVSHDRLEQGTQLHWPVPDASHPGTPILHVDRFTSGKGHFHLTEHLPAAELPDSEYPLFLTTGRVLYHWHGAEMTRRSSTLIALCPRSMVEIAEEDAEQLGIKNNQSIKVISRRGEMLATASINERVPEGVVFGNFHFPDEANVNNLTNAALDPIAKIPEYKVCAVRVEALV
jgi:formate dehydrogenase alpha subunit